MEGHLVYLARGLIVLGVIMTAIGLFLLFVPKIPLIGEYIGRLPGDIYIKREGFSFYFPVTTGIIVSLVITLVLYLFRR